MGSSYDYSFAEINERLRARGAVALMVALGFNFRNAGGVYFVKPDGGSPAMGKDSFAVWNNGSFKCYRTGKGGDFIGLIAHTNSTDQGAAIIWAKSYLGLGDAVARTHEEIAENRKKWAAKQAIYEASELKIKKQKIKAAKSAFLKATPAEGTIVQVYLEQVRCIDFQALKALPGSLRFEQGVEVYDDERDIKAHYPAMIGCFCNVAGEITGVHRTFLREDGLGKADLAKSKKMYGLKIQSFIPIHRGISDLSVKEAARRGKLSVLAIAEGIEDALTIAMLEPSWRVWAAGDKGNMARLEWPECASEVVLIADNDGATQIERDNNFYSIASAWERRAQGRPLYVKRSRHGKDFNDWLMHQVKGAPNGQ